MTDSPDTEYAKLRARISATHLVATVIPEPEHIVLGNHLSAVMTAHDAVKLSIAAHAEKEVAARDQRRRELEASRKLTEAQRGTT